MSSRKLSDLHPILQPIAKKFINDLDKQGIDILIYSTYRSIAEQNKLYSQGRTMGGNIVTWARGGESKHNFQIKGKPASLAFDCVPLINGKAYWNTDKEGVKIWQIIGLAGKNLGLDWAGDWRGFKKEFPHFQLNSEVIKYVEESKKAS